MERVLFIYQKSPTGPFLYTKRALQAPLYIQKEPYRCLLIYQKSPTKPKEPYYIDKSNLRTSQQSNGARPVPSAFWWKYT